MARSSTGKVEIELEGKGETGQPSIASAVRSGCCKSMAVADRESSQDHLFKKTGYYAGQSGIDIISVKTPAPEELK